MSEKWGEHGDTYPEMLPDKVLQTNINISQFAIEDPIISNNPVILERFLKSFKMCSGELIRRASIDLEVNHPNIVLGED